jgi:hypothetical protein
MLFEKICKVNNDNFGEKKINVIDNCKMVLQKKRQIYCQTGPYKKRLRKYYRKS